MGAVHLTSEGRIARVFKRIDDCHAGCGVCATGSTGLIIETLGTNQMGTARLSRPALGRCLIDVAREEKRFVCLDLRFKNPLGMGPFREMDFDGEALSW